MEPKDYYKTLGVAKGADTAEIKISYRKLARKYHPDVSDEADAETRFKQIGEAYQVLKDSGKRAEYDQLHSPASFSRSRYTQTDVRDFSDFFASIFSGGVQRAATSDGDPRKFHRRGEDIHHTLSLVLEDAQRGGEQQITLRIPERSAYGLIVQHEKTLDVEIPPGATQGQRIRLTGQGAAGLNGGEPGDLFVTIDIAPHPHFSLDNKNILLTLPVTDWETAIGATVEVPTLSGKVKVKIPPGSSHGDKLRIKGVGLTGAPPGDQLVILDVVASMQAIINSWRYDAL